jgi:modulator of FtsH protease HflC
MKSPVVLGIVLAALAFVGLSAVFVVDETEQVLVTQFGDPKKIVTEPGLNFKIPFVQELRGYDKRVLNLDPERERFLLKDQKPLIVDYFVRYRISDPLKFFQAVRDESVAEQRLERTVNTRLREALGRYLLPAVLSEERAAIMQEVRDAAASDTIKFGIEIVDVRIGKADLPDEINQTVFDRMKTEREQEAAQNRALGREKEREIKAAADREKIGIESAARRDAELLRGEGDGERTRLLNDAYGQDPEFFSFYRSMEAYRQSLTGGDSYMLLSLENDFFKEFNQHKSQ